MKKEMLVDEFVKFIESLPDLCADCSFVIEDGKEQVEIIIPGIMRERNVEIYIPTDKLKEFLQKIYQEGYLDGRWES